MRYEHLPRLTREALRAAADPAEAVRPYVMLWVKQILNRKRWIGDATAEDMRAEALARAVDIARLPPGDSRREDPGYYKVACTGAAIEHLRWRYPLGLRRRGNRSRGERMPVSLDGLRERFADRQDTGRSLWVEPTVPEVAPAVDGWDAVDRICGLAEAATTKRKHRHRGTRTAFLRRLAAGDSLSEAARALGSHPRQGKQLLFLIRRGLVARYGGREGLERHLGWS